MTEYEQRQIAEAIARAEAHRRRTGDGAGAPRRRLPYCPCSGPPAGAGRARCCCTAGWAGSACNGLLLAQMLTFVALCLLLRHPRLAAWLMPAILRRGVLPGWPGSSFSSRTCSAPPGHRGADLCQRGRAACGDPGR
jgi:putative membrane protein